MRDRDVGDAVLGERRDMVANLLLVGAELEAAFDAVHEHGPAALKERVELGGECAIATSSLSPHMILHGLELGEHVVEIAATGRRSVGLPEVHLVKGA